MEATLWSSCSLSSNCQSLRARAVQALHSHDAGVEEGMDNHSCKSPFLCMYITLILALSCTAWDVGVVGYFQKAGERAGCLGSSSRRWELPGGREQGTRDGQVASRLGASLSGLERTQDRSILRCERERRLLMRLGVGSHFAGAMRVCFSRSPVKLESY